MAEPSDHKRDVFDEDEKRGRSQHDSDTRLFGGLYYRRDEMAAMEQRLKAYGDIAADGHDLKIFRRDQERSAALAHQLSELNQQLEHARRGAEPGSRYALQAEYWRLAHEHQNVLADHGRLKDRAEQLEGQLRKHGHEPDPIPTPKAEPRFAALERDEERLRDLQAAQRASAAPRAAEPKPRPDFQLDQSNSHGPRRRGDVHPEERGRWFSWIRRQHDERENGDRAPPVPESERSIWSRPTMRTSEPHVDKRGNVRNMGLPPELVNQQVTLPRVRGLEHDVDDPKPQANSLRDMADRSVGEQFMPRDRSDDGPSKRRFGPNFGVEPTKREIEARARKSADANAYALPNEHVHGREFSGQDWKGRKALAPNYYEGIGRRGPKP